MKANTVLLALLVSSQAIASDVISIEKSTMKIVKNDVVVRLESGTLISPSVVINNGQKELRMCLTEINKYTYCMSKEDFLQLTGKK